ncbi:MAG: HAD family hydrolase [Flavobacteriaceae bacterium]
MSAFVVQGKRFQAAIFDMDGTLVDSMPYHHQAWIAFLDQQQLNISPEVFERDYHKGTMIEVMARLFPTVQDEAQLRTIGNKKEALFRRIYHPHLHPIAGLKVYFEKLYSQKIPLGLSTMGDQNNIDFTLAGIAMEHFFQATTGGHQVRLGKPAPEIFEATAHKLKINPKDCLAFEDTQSGIRSAQAAGMEVVGVATQFTKSTLLEELGCLAAIEDYEEMLTRTSFPT